MSSPKKMRALIEQVEQATGPDRELDAAITRLVSIPADAEEVRWSPRGEMRELRGRVFDGGGWGDEWWEVPTYTASLDAAVSLVPSGWGWAIKAKMEGAEFSSSCWNYLTGHGPSTLGATPALALVAAALRARLAREAGDAE